MRKTLTALLLTLIAVGVLVAQPSQPLDLRRFAPDSGFNAKHLDWLLPRGEQVIGGVRFYFGRVAELYGTEAAEQGHQRIDAIDVARKFEVLHLIAATARSAPAGAAVALIQLNYDDGTSTNLAVQQMVHTADYYNSRNELPPRSTDRPLSLAWLAQAADQSGWAKELRLFHSVFTNPVPAKTVLSLSLVSARADAGLIVAAISIAGKNSRGLNDTVPAPPSFNDTAPRSGSSVSIRGWVLSEDGKPLNHVRVRISQSHFIERSEYNYPLEFDDRIGADTAADGQFTLPPLPDDRRYRLLFSVDGFQPVDFSDIDPLRGPVQVWLKPYVQAFPKFESHVWARLLDPAGQPLPGAIVDSHGIAQQIQGQSARNIGVGLGMIPRVWSDARGEFLFEREKPFTELLLYALSPGLEPRKVWLSATNTLQTVTLRLGARIDGRILKSGKPLSGVRIGILNADPDNDLFAERWESMTDEQGNFSFKHLPPTKWLVYGVLRSLSPYGAIPPRLVHSGIDGTTASLGDIDVAPGLTLAGRVMSRSGEKLPSTLKFRVRVNSTRESDLVEVQSDGLFAVHGLNKGLIEVTLLTDGWRFTGDNSSLDDLDPTTLCGILETDNTGVSIVVERGSQYSFEYFENGQVPSRDMARNRPFFGSELTGPPKVIFKGSVIDDTTGAPIQLFSVTPGRLPPPIARTPNPPKSLLQQAAEVYRHKPIPWDERTAWDLVRREQFTNGHFGISFAPLSCQPLLRIEVPGYLPADTKTLGRETNLIVRLKKGSGPTGLVELPNGQPAEGATIYFAGDYHQGGLNTSGTLKIYSDDPKSLQTTGRDGRFAFSLPSNGRVLFFGHAQGWARLNATEIKNGSAVRLSSWAVVTGKLVDTNGLPQTNILLRLSAGGTGRRGDPFINIQSDATTDRQGRFQLRTIPPGQMLELVRIQASPPKSAILQTWLIAEPGKTNDLGNVVLDHPPAKPILDRLKAKIGL